MMKRDRIVQSIVLNHFRYNCLDSELMQTVLMSWDERPAHSQTRQHLPGLRFCHLAAAHIVMHESRPAADCGPAVRAGAGAGLNRDIAGRPSL